MGRKSKDFTLRPKKGKGKSSKVQSDPEHLLRRIRPDIFKTTKQKNTRRLSKRIRKGVDKILNNQIDNESLNSVPSPPPTDPKPRGCLKSTDGSTHEKRVTFKDLPPLSDDSSSGEPEPQNVDIMGSDDEEENLLPIELQAKEDQIQAEKDKIFEKMEIEEQIDDECKQVDVEFDHAETLDDCLPPNLEQIKINITNILYVLEDFKNRREEDRARKDYIKTLIKDLSLYYSYNEYLMTQLYHLFHKNIVDFLDSCETRRPLVIRTNTLKTRRKELAQSLIARGVNLDPVEWSPSGLLIYESQIPIGATPEYFAGHYILQGAASFIPVMALDPKPGEKILDMCSAPGGKTTHIAALMKNRGILYANDINSARCQSVVGNSQRLGVANMILMSKDGRKMPKMNLNVDRVLLDAPCSGTGVIANDASVKMTRVEEDVKRRSHLQKELILAAIDCVKEGGVVVYSTCSLLVEENESVVEYALSMRKVKLVETGASLGENGFVRFGQYRFNPSMRLTRRYYPHVHNLDGFFVAKLGKI